MLIVLPEMRLMPYAVDNFDAAAVRVVRQGRGGLELEAPFPCLALTTGRHQTVRLNNSRFDLDGMPDLSEAGGSEAQFLRELVRRQCRPWDAAAHRLVDGYFDVLDELMREHADELAERAAPFAGLFEAAHWLFSAPRPFPRAHVFAPLQAPAAVHSADDYVMVDFAFRLEDGIVVLLSAQSGLTPRRARERLDRLRASGARVETFQPSDLVHRARDVFVRALAPELPAFWRADPLPIGPFRSAVIED